jgi:predicted ATPase
LPVLVEPIIANQGDVVIIQQPEIHLHPKAQSILADYFIWVAKTKDITLFIETHSEYLLRRLRRRIAEGANSKGDDLAIKPSEVSILSIEKNGDS